MREDVVAPHLAHELETKIIQERAERVEPDIP
jgi:hypothetical protein